jgi:hypothetical protein
VPFALWPAFPTSDYYGTSDAAQASPADLLASVTGQPPVFMGLDSTGRFRWRLSPQPIRSLRFPTVGEVKQVIRQILMNQHHVLADSGSQRDPVSQWLGRCPTGLLPAPHDRG